MSLAAPTVREALHEITTRAAIKAATGDRFYVGRCNDAVTRHVEEMQRFVEQVAAGRLPAHKIEQHANQLLATFNPPPRAGI